MFAPYYIPPMGVWADNNAQPILTPAWLYDEDVIWLAYYYMVNYGY